MISKLQDTVIPSRTQAAWLVRAAVAAVLYGSGSMVVLAAAPPASDAAKDGEPAEETLEEVQVTGSRIIRKDMTSNSPLVTIERQQLEDSTFISIEEALNDL